MTTMLEIPSACQPLMAPLQSLLSALMAQLACLLPGQSLDYASVERQVAQGAAEIEKAAHQVLLHHLDVDAPGVLIDGKKYIRAGRFEATYHTMAGDVVLERTLYRDAQKRSGPTVDAVSLRAGVVGAGWLPEAAKAMAYLMQQGTSREAHNTAQQLCRLPYSRSSFDRVGHDVGELYVQSNMHVEQVLIETLDVPPQATGLSVSLDRVSVPMEEPNPTPPPRPPGEERRREVIRVFRMAYCGTVTLHDQEGRALQTIRYGRMPQGDAIGLCEGLASDVEEMRKKRPDLLVTLLADGSEEMWNLLDEQLNKQTLGVKPTRLVDFWHTLEKLGSAARVVYGDKADREVTRWRLLLLNDSAAAAQILGELRASTKEWVSIGEKYPVHEAITYLENHPDQMDYAEARRQGRPIGSGAVEATCKSLFEVRLKRSGSRWKEVTGEHIVQLRALALSERWSEAMRLTLAPLRKTVRLVA